MSSTAGESGQLVVRRAPRWMWILMILSLALNLLIIGIVLGSMWAVRKGGYWNVPIALERSQRFMRGLPTERRSEIRSVFFEHRDELLPFWRDVRNARVRIGRLIENGGYSAEELGAAMDDLFQKEMSARQAAKPMIASMVAKLKPEERLHFLRVYLPYLDEVQGRAAAQPLD